MRMLAVAVVVAIASTPAMAAPAQAVDSYVYLNNNYWNRTWVAHTTGAVGRVNLAVPGVGHGGGDYPYTLWRYQPRGTLNGHELVKFQNDDSGYCLDSRGSVVEIWASGCNTGAYQLWEVFRNANGSRTYKSYGAWINQHAHVCMKATGGDGWRFRLYTCSQSDTGQQWWNRGD